MRAARIKLAHQWSCGCCLYFSQTIREGPPTSRTYSPLVGAAAGACAAVKTASKMSNAKSRFMRKSWEQYLCWDRVGCNCDAVLPFRNRAPARDRDRRGNKHDHE